jgi:NADH dehydrogenase
MQSRRKKCSPSPLSFISMPDNNEMILTKSALGSNTDTTSTDPDKERIVILGSGWAGYALGRTLSPKKSSRILISPRSHFVFTPLLASTAVGTLEFRAAIEPVRRLNVEKFHQGWVSDIDFKRKVIRMIANTDDEAITDPTNGADHALAKCGAGNGDSSNCPEFEVPYDKVVLAVGCYSQTFGVQGVKEHAFFLRDVGDARAIRQRVLKSFERAALPTTDEAERAKLLHFAVVGGGPTGIEFAAEMHDLIHDDLSKLYPCLMKHVAVTIYDIAPKVLPMFDQNLANYATDLFRRQGIKVKTQHHLERIRRDGEHLLLKIKEEKEEVGAGLVVWSTGLMQNPLVKKLLDKENAEGVGKLVKDPKTGGIVTDSHMRVKTTGGSNSSNSSNGDYLPDVYAVGDCAVVEGQNYPATAQVASQEAIYLAKRINNKDADTGPAFKFRNLGTMAYLGSWRAIHQSKADEIKGRAAWILWRTAYLTKSMSIRNKILIPIYWAITWLFGRDISRF